MRTVGSWGGAIEMAVASRILEVAVHVYERASGRGAEVFSLISAFNATSTESGASRAAVVRVLYSGRCHYDALEAR